MKIKQKKDTLICVDRDGTLIYDDTYHLGKDNYWKDKIKFLPSVIGGLQILRKKLNNSCRFIISNQPGVAIKDFKRLDLKRAQKVTKEILQMLKSNGAYFDGFVVCPHPSPDYIKENPHYEYDKKLICPECDCFKPNIGMIKDTMKKKNLDPLNTNIYVIGDRAEDVKTALNAKGTGILVPFENRPKEALKVKSLINKKTKNNIYIAEDFLDAVQFILERER